MKNNNVSLKEWGKQFSLSQKKNAKKANNYYVVVEEFKKIRKELVLLNKNWQTKWVLIAL